MTEVSMGLMTALLIFLSYLLINDRQRDPLQVTVQGNGLVDAIKDLAFQISCLQPECAEIGHSNGKMVEIMGQTYAADESTSIPRGRIVLIAEGS